MGAGPAGLAAAIALKRICCNITVVDCAVPPIDKACGEGLLPDSVSALRQLGVEIPENVGFAFRGVRFANGHSSVAADFPNGVGKGLRRTTLHQLLIARAKALSIPIVWDAKRIRIMPRGIAVSGDFVDADLIVGADGQQSSIRRQAMLDRSVKEERRYAFRIHYRAAPWSPYVEVHWGRRSQIYVTPIATDKICVASLSRDPRLRVESALHEFPEIRERLKAAVPISTEMGALSVSRNLKSVQRNNVVLLGDASGSVDAITGEGMCLAFRQAAALAESIASNNLGKYQQLHRRLMRRPRIMSAVLLALERNSQLQTRTVNCLAWRPEIFGSLLAVHVGCGSFAAPRLFMYETLGSFGRCRL